MKVIPILSIFSENKPGKLAKITEVLAKNNINILGFSIISVKDFGVIKLLVNQADKAYALFKKEGFTVSLLPALGIEMEDKPGGLYQVAKLIFSKGINIESALVYVAEARKRAYFVFETEDIERAWELLKGEKINFLESKELV